MYRVVIVDDEPWALKGIRSTFRWQEYGFEIVAETTDSEEAWEMIQHEKPDAVLTDIRMPELSGIDLMRLSREAGLDTAFIIISGVADFHYAKDSIRLGCFDYLLKPLQFDEADAVLLRLSEHLQSLFRQKQKALQELLAPGKEAQLEQLLGEQGFHWRGRELQVLYVEAANEAWIEMLDSWLMEVEHFAIRPEKNREVILTCCDHSLYPLMEAKWHEGGSQPGLYVGVSRRSACFEDLAELAAEANQARQASFIYPEGGVFQYRKEVLTELRKQVNELCAALRHPAEAYPAPRFETLPDVFRKEGAGMKDVVYFWNQLVSTLHIPADEGGIREGVQFMDSKELAERFGDFGQVCNYLKQLIPSETGTVETSLLVNENFSKLLDYVNFHFMDELHLKELSHRFYINYTYCCDLFQKVTKSTFTDYITRLRMKKAEALLRNPAMTIVEICRQVGYKDYTYFNKVFKKWYGLTPSNYRKSKLIN